MPQHRVGSACALCDIVCISGMMRTGSSALTRGLGALGLDLGGQIQKLEAIVNPTGFWEDAQVYDALHRVYQAISLGDHMSNTVGNISASSWDRPSALSRHRRQKPQHRPIDVFLAAHDRTDEM